MSDQAVRLGVIGLGVMGGAMLEVALAAADVTVTGVADQSDETLARVRAAHPELTFAAPADLATADRVDAVYIATPPASHAELAIAAMRAGKAVFCEKPLAVDIAEGTRMSDVSVETGMVNVVNFPFATMPATGYLEQQLLAGAVGEVLAVDVQLRYPLWPRPFQATATWVGERAEGGFVREVFSHFSYLTDRLVGPVAAVDAAVEYPADPTVSEIAAHGLLRAGDVPVHMTGRAGMAGPGADDWTLWGSTRSYQLRNWTDLYTSDGGPWSPVEMPAGGRGATLAGLVNAVRGEPSGKLADFAAALRVQTAVEAFFGEQSS
ncbi:MAG TPA: Gfo/Idh/MocA family oxidoreductase [Pseudonocardiaceae bacterium]|nr:Gfo/Idh/MocA family oxidoreductase [Pseudonocardiaceae bacterium]